mgnify:CR=1 FL=1
MAKQFKPETLCVQAGWTPKKGEPRVLPIYQSTTFKYDTSEQMARLFPQTRRIFTECILHHKSYKEVGELLNISPLTVKTVMARAFKALRVNHAVMGAGGKAIMFTSLPEYFRKLFIGSNIWQTMGFNAIIFIAALTAISPEYYEAATMDGASRFQKILYIDLPLIMPTIILMLILQVGNIMNVGYEKAYLMQNGTNTTVSEIISTYVYKVGLQTAQYSFATAVGLFNSVVNFIILVITNAVAKKTSDISIF